MGMLRRLALSSATILLVIGAMACSTPTVPPASTARPAGAVPTAAAAGSFVLTSTAFSDGSSLPKKYSCDGENVSPPIKWSGAPAGTKGFALILDDPDAPGGTFTHWVVFDLPASRTELAEGAKDVGKGGLNGRRQTGYTGACPPSGTHRYFFTLYAVDIASLGVNEGASRSDVEKALQNHIVGKTQLMATYSR